MNIYWINYVYILVENECSVNVVVDIFVIRYLEGWSRDLGGLGYLRRLCERNKVNIVRM